MTERPRVYEITPTFFEVVIGKDTVIGSARTREAAEVIADMYCSDTKAAPDEEQYVNSIISTSQNERGGVDLVVQLQDRVQVLSLSKDDTHKLLSDLMYSFDNRLSLVFIPDAECEDIPTDMIVEDIDPHSTFTVVCDQKP